MLYLLWSLINIVLILYFVYLFLGFIAVGRKILGKNTKWISVPVLAVGLINLVAAAGPEDKNSEVLIGNSKKDEIEMKYRSIVVEDNFSLEFSLGVDYYLKDGEVFLVKSLSNMTGLLPGFEYDYLDFSAGEVQENGMIPFSAVGLLKWKLGGISVYSETKPFKGNLQL